MRSAETTQKELLFWGGGFFLSYSHRTPTRRSRVVGPACKARSLFQLRAAFAQASHGTRGSMALHRLFIAIMDASSEVS